MGKEEELKKQLSGLSREELVKLYLMANEAEKRHQKNIIDTYNRGEKVHHKQMKFHEDKHRNRWAFGGNRTGKTECGAVEAVWFARGNHPFRNIDRPMVGWVVSLTNEVQRDVAQKKVLHYLNPDWILDVHVRKGRKDDPHNAVIDFMVIESLHGGKSIIGFKSCDQGREKFQGTDLDFCWFDEEPPKPIYDECKMRLIDRRGDMWGTMTPLKGLTWIYDSIYVNEIDDPEISTHSFSWADNPFLPYAEIMALEATMTETERKSRQHGKFVAMSGLVYNSFDPDIHVIDPFDVPRDWYDNISIDPGLNAPLSCHWYACDNNGNVFVIAEHYKAGEGVAYHADKIKKISKELGWQKSRTGKIRALGDSASDQKTLAAEKSVTQLFWEYDIMLDTSVDKSKWTGIQRVKQFLKLYPLHKSATEQERAKYPNGKPKIYIFATCTNMIKEFKQYRWKEQKIGSGEPDEPVKKNDHAMDELRYYIMSKPEPYIATAQKISGTWHRNELKMRGYSDSQINRLRKNGNIALINE